MAVAITRPSSDLTGEAASSAVASYANVNIGAAAADRVVVVCIGTELTASVPTAVTINSTGAAVAMTHAEAATQGAVNADIWYKAVPTSTAATIAVTFGAVSPSSVQNHIAAFRVVGVNPAAAPFDTGAVADTDADPITSSGVALIINTDGGGIAICAMATDTTARTWTGFTEDLDVDAGGFRFSTGMLTAASTVPITVSGGNNEDGALSWIIFNPGAVQKTIAADAGSYALTGTDATPRHAWKAVPDAGSYVLTGTDATLSRGLKVVADSGSYAMTGTDAAMRHDWKLPVDDVGAYLLTGTNVTLTYSGASAGQHRMFMVF